MSEIRVIFWDIGGVLLSNGLDREQRAQLVERFGLDASDFQERHKLVVSELEQGRLGLDAYLDQTVFHQSRSFDREAFRAAMLALSTPHDQTLALARLLAHSLAGRVRMYALNNESRELNAHRIQTFGLGDFLLAFFSSCYLGVMKPGPAIYRLALDLAGVRPEQALMIDDRPQNAEAAVGVGMQAVVYQSAGQLRAELERLGIGADPLR
jgi:putative hydrolase of the HAD superfamily